MAKLDPAVELVLDEVRSNRFYGSVELKFEAGKLVIIKKSETIKPQSYRDSRVGEAGS